MSFWCFLQGEGSEYCILHSEHRQTSPTCLAGACWRRLLLGGPRSRVWEIKLAPIQWVKCCSKCGHIGFSGYRVFYIFNTYFLIVGHVPCLHISRIVNCYVYVFRSKLYSKSPEIYNNLKGLRRWQLMIVRPNQRTLVQACRWTSTTRTMTSWIPTPTSTPARRRSWVKTHSRCPLPPCFSTFETYFLNQSSREQMKRQVSREFHCCAQPQNQRVNCHY